MPASTFLLVLSDLHFLLEVCLSVHVTKVGPPTPPLSSVDVGVSS